MSEELVEDSFDIDIEADEINISLELDKPKPVELPKVYLYLENLVMLQQVKGLVEDGTDLVTVPAYADRRGEKALVGTVELTSENVLTMQQLGLKVTLVRQGKSSINFDKAEEFVSIVKTLKEVDTKEIVYELPKEEEVE